MHVYYYYTRVDERKNETDIHGFRFKVTTLKSPVYDKENGAYINKENATESF